MIAGPTWERRHSGFLLFFVIPALTGPGRADSRATSKQFRRHIGGSALCVYGSTYKYIPTTVELNPSSARLKLTLLAIPTLPHFYEGCPRCGLAARGSGDLGHRLRSGLAICNHPAVSLYTAAILFWTVAGRLSRKALLSRYGRTIDTSFITSPCGGRPRPHSGAPRRASPSPPIIPCVGPDFGRWSGMFDLASA